VRPAELKNLMTTLDDAWNAQDWDVFEQRHTEDTIVRWPGQPEPTRGIEHHRDESVAFFSVFDNRLQNRPYQVLLAQDDWTCSVARWTGRMIGPMTLPDGRTVPSTGRSFELDFCTVARWRDDGRIAEENLFYDQLGLYRQIGVEL
jgi:ketosteroid isomerase-like protein